MNENDQQSAGRRRTKRPGVKAQDVGGETSLERKQIRIDASSDAVMSQIGGGNLSLGIREAARRLVEAEDTEPFSLQRHSKRMAGKEG